jgi:hypothetical protein
LECNDTGGAKTMGQMTVEQQQALALASARLRLQQSTTGDLASQIPGSSVQAPASTAAPERPESGFFGKLMAPLETAVTLGTSAITAPIVEGAKIYGTLTSGKYGTQAGIRAGEETGRKVQQFFQSPVSPESERQTQAIGNALASTGLQGVPLNVMGNMATLARPAVQQVAPVIKAPLEARQQRVQEARVAESYKNAPRIDAAQAGQRLGVALNPAESNPTVANKMKSVLGGTADIDARLSKFNLEKITEQVRNDLGVAAAEKLDDAAINRALDVASAPYDPIRAMPVLQASDDVLSSILALDKPATLGGKAQASAARALIDDAVTELQAGRSGAQIIDDIRQLRRTAQSVYKARDKGNNPAAADVARADAQMGIANALEKMIDENAPDPQTLTNLRQARQRMAQIYDHERALDYATGTVDPKAYAKLLDERKGNMTGVGADIGKVAANFPKVVGTDVVSADIKPRLTRSGVGGTLGFIVGGVPGAALGAGAGYIASAASAKRMMSPKYQAANAMPADFRPISTGLKPVEPNVPVNALAPYDYSQSTFTPPNFVMQGEQYGPRVVPGTPEAPLPNTLGYNPNVPSTAEVQMNRLRREDVMDRDFVAQRVAAQEAQQAAAESAARQPARGGMVLDIDPVTGKLVPGAEGTRGMTPDIQIIESTGKSLSGAADLLASGKSPALMSAEQKIAWDKTKVDLAEVVPGMKTLNDKAIAAKMLDREWVQEAITKAQQKAKMLDDIIARADNERLRQDAMMKREQMTSMLETLEEQFRKARPVKTGGQGPKTRAFQRNMLSPEQEIQNALAK